MLNNLTTKKDIRTFSVCPENLTGEKGKGGMAVTGTASNCARDLGQGWKVNPFIVLKGKETAVLADIKGQGAIKHIWITDSAAKGRLLILRIYFDGHKNPAVEAPLSDFFANAEHTEYRQLSSLAMCFNPGRGMNCYFEMPYFKSFRIELENIDERDCNVYYQIDCEEKVLPENSLYFHAQFRRVNPLPYKEVYTILDNIKGNGHYVGTYMHWGVKSNGWWGEGEIKFYIDGDTDFPSICGTGTEDYFCGSYAFGNDTIPEWYQTYSGLYAGLYAILGDCREKYNVQQRFLLYRWHDKDPVYFDKSFRMTIDDGVYAPPIHSPRYDDFTSVAFYYLTEPKSLPFALPSHLELFMR